jgi:hypothetical protein
VSLEKDALQAAMARAIVDSVTPEVQREVFQKAILEHLFTVRRDGYSGKETTTLSEVFAKALDRAVFAITEKVLNEPDNQEMIVSAVRSAFEQTVVKSALLGKLTERLTRNISNW